MPELLQVKDVSVSYQMRNGGRKHVIQAVDGVSFTIRSRQIVGLAGESGSGKSTIGRALVRLLKIDSGSIYFSGEPVHRLSESEFQPYRKRIQMVFQDPYHTLNPRLTIGETLEEPLKIHFKSLSAASRRERVCALLDQVGLDVALIGRYPHQFSGGQRQRVGIARALAVEPELLICDEAVSALDVSVQAQIVNLLQDLQESYGFACLFIGHDLAVMKHISDEILIMEQGRIVEHGTTRAVFETTQQPYTRRLIDAAPKLQSLHSVG